VLGQVEWKLGQRRVVEKVKVGIFVGDVKPEKLEARRVQARRRLHLRQFTAVTEDAEAANVVAKHALKVLAAKLGVTHQGVELDPLHLRLRVVVNVVRAARLLHARQHA